MASSLILFFEKMRNFFFGFGHSFGTTGEAGADKITVEASVDDDDDFLRASFFAGKEGLFSARSK